MYQNQASTRSHFIVLKQLLNLISRSQVHRLRVETGIETKASSFYVFSHMRRLFGITIFWVSHRI